MYDTLHRITNLMTSHACTASEYIMYFEKVGTRDCLAEAMANCQKILELGYDLHDVLCHLQEENHFAE